MNSVTFGVCTVAVFAMGVSPCEGIQIDIGSSTCEYDGETYEYGDEFPDKDGCNDCECGALGVVICTRRACADECDYNGEKYKVGDTFPADDHCNTCECLEGGVVACTVMTCPGIRCGGIEGLECPDGLTCVYDDPDCGGDVIPRPRPLDGDGEETPAADEPIGSDCLGWCVDGGDLCEDNGNTYSVGERWEIGDPECPGFCECLEDGMVMCAMPSCDDFCDLVSCPSGRVCDEAARACVRDTRCDRGELFCDGLEPECNPGEVAAIRDGCWECVDPETCGPYVCSGVVCTLYCENGFATGPDGCEICECKEDDCRTTGCEDGTWCGFCWTTYACIPDGAVC